MNAVSSKYRIDLELVDAAGLMKMQTKLNQWSTAGPLVKFETQDMGGQILFKIIRLKTDKE